MTKITANFFKEAEFQRCVPSCSLQDMNQETMRKLDRAREIAGIPFVLTSAFRTVAHEKSKGREGTSAHTTGRAVDIRAASSRNRFLVVKGLMEAGFTRIGINVVQNFVHVDDSPNHEQNVLFPY